MAPLPKTTAAAIRLYLLRAKVRDLHTAYEVSIRAIDERLMAAEDTVRKGWGLAPDETPPEPEYVEGAGYAPDFWDQVADIAVEMNVALKEVRRAFLISLFHVFEREAKTW